MAVRDQNKNACHAELKQGQGEQSAKVGALKKWGQAMVLSLPLLIKLMLGDALF